MHIVKNPIITRGCEKLEGTISLPNWVNIHKIYNKYAHWEERTD